MRAGPLEDVDSQAYLLCAPSAASTLPAGRRFLKSNRDDGLILLPDRSLDEEADLFSTETSLARPVDVLSVLALELLDPAVLPN